MAKITASPGLMFCDRKDGSRVAYWRRMPGSTYANYRPKTMRLWAGRGDPTEEEMEEINCRCQSLQKDMMEWRWRPRAKMKAKEGYVYFVEGGGLIKIGFSIDPQRRLAAMMIGCPVTLTLLGTLRGNEATERRLHAKFSRFRVRYEWFEDAPKIREFISAECGYPARERKQHNRTATVSATNSVSATVK